MDGTVSSRLSLRHKARAGINHLRCAGCWHSIFFAGEMLSFFAHGLWRVPWSVGVVCVEAESISERDDDIRASFASACFVRGARLIISSIDF